MLPVVGIVLAVFAATAGGDAQNDFYVANVFPLGLAVIKDKVQMTKLLSQERLPQLPGPLDALLKISIQKVKTWIHEQGPNASRCGLDFLDFLLALKNAEPWAIAMVDAYGKMGSGITQGNLVWAGDYGLCLGINATPAVNISFLRTYKTQYCWANFALLPAAMASSQVNLSQTQYLRSAICVPESCSATQLNKLMHFVLDFIPIGSYFNFTGVDCVAKELDLWEDRGAVASFIICCFFILLMLTGTCYDVFCHKKSDVSQFDYTTLCDSDPNLNSDHNNSINKVDPSDDGKAEEIHSASSVSIPTTVAKQPNKSSKGIAEGILLSFSMYTNGSKILSLAPGKESITVLNGIRFFSMTWVILGHTFMLGCMNLDNQAVIIDVSKTLLFQVVVEGVLAVDTFFLLSGLLVTYLFLKEYERTSGRISWLRYYFHRIWRLTPPYVFILFLFYMRLSKYFSNGPFWPEAGFSGSCEQNWWWNLLYINNFNPIKEMCMGWTWYLANDMQFYILSPIILVPLARRSISTATIIAGCIVLISCICNGAISTYYGLNINLDIVNNGPGSPNYISMFDHLYSKPYTRVGPYVMGMMCGWWLFKCKCQMQLKKHWVVAGWLAAIAIALSVVLGTYHAHLGQAVSSLYYSLAKVGWSVSLCWLIIACSTGHGGFVNSFLSWSAWSPLSRLTYTAYLWHCILLLAVFLSVEVPMHFSYTFFIYYYLAMILVTYIGALVLSLAFESPLLALERLLFPR